MSKTDRKVLAFAAGTAMALSTLVGAVPAQAAPNNVELAATSGDRYSVFATDGMSLDVTLPTFMPSATANANFAFIITNPDSEDLDITFQFEGDDTQVQFDFMQLDEFNDVIVTTASSAGVDANNAAVDNTAVTFDFTPAISGGNGTATSMIVYGFDDSGASNAGKAPLSMSIASNGGAYGDAEFSIGVTAWVDSEGEAFNDVDTIEASTVSETRTITFVDPQDASAIVKLERVVSDDDTAYLNVDGQTTLAGTARFSKLVNLDQTNFANWEFDVLKAGSDHNLDVTENATIRSGYDSMDDAGEALVRFALDANLADDSTYQVETRWIGSVESDERTFSSNAFEVVTASDTDVDGVAIEVTESANAVEVSASASTLRTGSAVHTYTVQATDGGVDLEVANIPVVVVVTATEGTVAVSGSADGTIEGAAVYNTLTDDDGQVTVTVTSSAAEDDSYTVKPYVVLSTGLSATATAITATYEDGEITSWEADSAVYTGDSVTMTVTVEDQFEEAVSVDGDGDTIRVTAVATDDANLEQTVNIVNGEATITFDNYLAEGETDVITLDAHTGPYDDKTSDLTALSDIDVTLYADQDVQAVTLTDDTLTTKVGYTPFSDDPILDGGDPTLTAGNKATLNGTVIDSSGAGIPGAAVTMTAAGVQFKNGTTYEVGEISFAATEAGTFEVDVWSHMADDVEVTITSGGKSAVATLEGELMADNNIDAGDLVLSWNLPANVVFNTTYAVTATLTDVWGNPINGASVTFTGEAAAQFNSDATADKVTGSKGTATAYLRSLEDVSGLAAVSLEVTDIDTDDSASTDVTNLSSAIDDNEDTPWDESSWSNSIEAEITFLTSAPAASADAKVNAGSFKGYVAVYAKGYEGQRLSAKIGNDWVIVPSLASSFERIVDFTGAGVDIAVRIYIDRVLLETINLTTK